MMTPLRSRAILAPMLKLKLATIVAMTALAATLLHAQAPV